MLKWVHDEYNYINKLVKDNNYVTLLIANGDLLFDVDHSVLDIFNESPLNSLLAEMSKLILSTVL